MLIESGHYFLAFSAFLLFTQSSFFLALTAITLLFSLFCLFVSYACSDFSVINVFINSNHQLPVFYKISGAWSNHEGSMLLWAWILSVFCILFLIRSRLSAKAINIRPQLILSCILFYFCIFLLATSNPYLRLLLISPEAMAELNPVLQDPILAIHPPLIYAGYVASAIGFAVCLCICIKSYKTKNDWSEDKKKSFFFNEEPRSFGDWSSQKKRKHRIQAALKAGSLFALSWWHSRAPLRSNHNVCSKQPRSAQTPPPRGGGLLGDKCFLNPLRSNPLRGVAMRSILKTIYQFFSFQLSTHFWEPLPLTSETQHRSANTEEIGARQAVKAIALSEWENDDKIVSGSALSVIRTYQDWGWKEIRIWTLICWCFLTVGILLGSWWAYHELGWGGWWFWDPVENASFMPWVLSTALAHSIIYAGLRIFSVFLSFAIFVLSLLGTFFVRSGFLASVHSFASDSSRGLFFILFLIGLVILCTLVFYQLLEGENRQKMTRKAESFTRIQNVFALIVCTVVLCGTAAPVLFSLIFGRDVSAGAPFFNGTILPISGAVLILCIFAQLDSRSFLNIVLILFTFVFHTVLAYFIGGLPICESVFFSIASLLFYTLLLLSRTSMQLAHGGLCVFIAGIIFSNPYKSQATQMLNIGDVFSIDKNTVLILRGIDQLYGPTFQSICASLLVDVGSETNHFVDNSSAFPIFPEKRFYYSQTDSSTTKVAVKTNGFSDVYALIGSGNIETGWYTTVIKLPFITCIWIGFFLSSLGGFFSLQKQLKMPRLFWV